MAWERGCSVQETPRGQNITPCTKTTATQRQLPPLFSSTRGCSDQTNLYSSSNCAIKPVILPILGDLGHETRSQKQIFTKNLQLETSDLYYTPVWLCEPDSNQQPLDKIAVSVLGLSQRLNIDFKGPLPSVSSNRDVLTVCEVTSRTTAYKSSRKGTRKGYHGVIWKAITLTQWFQQLPIEQWEEALDLTITLDTFINVGSNQHNSPSLGIPHFSCSLFSEEHRRVHSSQSGKFTRPKCTQQIQTEKSMEYAMPIRGQICLQWRSLKERKLKEKITSGM
ncbi:hypothetical protein T05_591 [Trichinella murrelli]|uniref:Uncharacterized protein n=1 Tax=Trichinella murrelli TaxID=144512 RepID=A0A0V0U7T4_9BILA|nr:hypothetical protein T05_591 [Trichinella murrelli]